MASDVNQILFIGVTDMENAFFLLFLPMPFSMFKIICDSCFFGHLHVIFINIQCKENSSVSVPLRL